MSRIARAAFNGAPTDQLQTVDVYGEVDTSVRNAYQSQFTAFGQALNESLGAIDSAIGGIMDRFEQGRMTLEQAEGRIKDTLRGARGEIDKLSHDVKNNVMSTIQNNGIVNQLQVGIGEASTLIEKVDRDVVNSTMSVLRDITGSNAFDVIDREVEKALYQGVIGELLKWDAPTLVKRVLDEITDPVIRRVVVVGSSLFLMDNPTIANLKALLEASDPNALTSQHPDLLEQVLRQYSLEQTDTPADYPTRLTELVEVLTQLNPDWLTLPRGEGDVWNLGLIRYASEDARLVFLQEEPYRSALLTSDTYVLEKPRDLMKKMYPQIALA